MKLTKEIVSQIRNITQTAQLVGIDSVIIEKEMVRAIDDEKTVLIFHEDTLNLPFDAIALNRLGNFTSRLDIAQSDEGLEIDAETDEDATSAKVLNMKGKKLKISYRCANPSVIKAPRQIQDVMRHKVSLSAEIVATLAKAAAAMGSDTITVVSDADGDRFEMSDVNKDIFALDFTGSIRAYEVDAKRQKEAAAGKFSHKYPTKILLSLFKKVPDGEFLIGASGLLNIKINDINLYVLPQV
jgi:hypothetical protein